ncbi:MAG: glycosyltransferase [Weeksellaceae bacterium]|nr:glycosyltransferase [Weeksellaceae bacterium]
MKFIQIFHKYDPYISYFEEKYRIEELNPDFETLRNLLIKDGFYGPHILKPIFDESGEGFYTMWDYDRLQRTWAKENNAEISDLNEILKLQISTFNPEAIYNMSPQKIDISEFEDFRTKNIVCWNADPYSINNQNLVKYDALLTSSVIKAKESSSTFLHYPSTDPQMKMEEKVIKDIDVFFYGQYDGVPFKERRAYISELVDFFNKKNISFKFALMYKESETVLYNYSIISRFDFAKKFDPPRKLSKYFSKPIFGKDIYKDISRAKIVFNISAEHEKFGDFKFNMRIFETLGVGGFMISDEGKYPPHLEGGKDFVTYENVNDLKAKISHYLTHENEREKIGKCGKNTVEKFYSKENQWENFKNIITQLQNETIPN